jgi:HD-GYP domain-containing protein (c-di-GMP phosphodiesterase class II)
MTKRELLQRAINELAKRDPTRYFSIAEIAAQAGRQFDPALVTAFLGINHGALV